MHTHALARLSSVLVLAGSLFSQSSQDPLTPPTEEQAIVAGRRAGTERWIAHFEKRSFTLDAFRTAVYERRSKEEVAGIVADMQRRVQIDQTAFVTAVEALGGEVVAQWWLVNAAAFEIAPAQLDRVRALANVTRLEPSRWVHPIILTATNANNHNSDAVNASGREGFNVCTAIMDTGQDSNMGGVGRPHRMYYINGDPTNLGGGGLNGSRLVVNRQIGTQPPDDVHGHGTGVASIVASGGWLNAGADKGHAPLAQLAGYAISNNTGGGSDFTTIANAWQAIATDRVALNIVSANNSYSGSNDATNVSQQALDSCAYNADVLICCAAANSGASTSVSQSVANGLAVAAVNPNVHTVATFSSRGPLASDPARFYPDISGCGVSTVMALRNNESGNYVASGTSMASPQVCGAATLVRADNIGLRADETKAVLLASARDISAQNPSPPYNSRNAYGMGLLRDDDAIAIGGSALRHGRSTLSTATTTKSYQLPVTSGTNYQVAIAWHRTNFAVTTWANLDLAIYNGAALVAQSNTTRNLYEMVRFTPTFSGTVEIRVTATSFETGTTSQEFAWASNHDILSGGIVSPITANGVEGTSSNAFPFTSAVLRRYQQIHSDLPAGPLSVSRLAFRANTPSTVTNFTGTRTMTVDMFIGTGPASYAAVSRNYASNFSSRTQVLTGQTINWGPQGTTVSPGPQPFAGVNTDIAIPTYVWPGGTLAWELAMYSNTGVGTFGTIDADQGSVTTAPATTTGAGCTCTGRATAQTLSLSAADMQGHFCLQLGTSNGPSTAPLLLAIGTANPNLPFPGLCSNVYTNLSVPPFFVGTTSATGALASQEGFTLAVPNTFAGATLYLQGHAVDAGQAGLPICNSNGVSLTVPTPNTSRVVQVSRMFDNSNTTTATTGVFFATSSLGYGLVVEFN